MRLLFSTIAKYISLGFSSFSDFFSSRANTTTGLGTSTSGGNWQALNGLINVVSGAAKASTVPTAFSAGGAYPISTVPMTKSDVNIKLKNTKPGSMAAIWVKSANEWWGVATEEIQTSTPGNANFAWAWANGNYYTSWWGPGSIAYNYAYSYTYWYAGTPTYTRVAWFVYGFSASTTYGVANYSITYSASYGTRYNSKYALAYTVYTWGTTNANYKATGTNYSYVVNSTFYAYNSANTSLSATGNATGSSTYNYYTVNNAAGPNVFNFSFQSGTNATTYTVSRYVDIIQSTPSAVSTISSTLVSTTQSILSLFISIAGNQITTRAYSDNNTVSQIGSNLVYTATGATITTQYGIGLSVSPFNQSDIIASSVEIDVV